MDGPLAAEGATIKRAVSCSRVAFEVDGVQHQAVLAQPMAAGSSRKRVADGNARHGKRCGPNDLTKQLGALADGGGTRSRFRARNGAVE